MKKLFLSLGLTISITCQAMSDNQKLVLATGAYIVSPLITHKGIDLATRLFPDENNFINRNKPVLKAMSKLIIPLYMLGQSYNAMAKHVELALEDPIDFDQHASIIKSNSFIASSLFSMHIASSFISLIKETRLENEKGQLEQIIDVQENDKKNQ